VQLDTVGLLLHLAANVRCVARVVESTSTHSSHNASRMCCRTVETGSANIHTQQTGNCNDDIEMYGIFNTEMRRNPGIGAVYISEFRDWKYTQAVIANHKYLVCQCFLLFTPRLTSLYSSFLFGSTLLITCISPLCCCFRTSDGDSLLSR
jgi:hypothetical protein